MIAAVVGLALVAAACGDDDDAGSATTAAAASETTAASASTAAAATTTAGDDEATTTAAAASDTTEAAADDTAGGEPATLRLGYFPNVTHAPALVGVAEGTFAEALGSNVDLELSTFNAGTDVIDGAVRRRPRRQLHRPQPGDQRLRQVGGRRPAHRRRHDVGRRLPRRQPGHQQRRRPQGQDAGHALARQHPGRRPALRGSRSRAWTTDTSGGGDVSITPQENADTLNAFKTGAIYGAWVPEPWATRLVDRGRRQGAGRRERPVARRPVRHDPPDRQPHATSRSTPTSSST